MEIEIAEIKEALCLIFDHCLKHGVHTVELEDDYYWNILKSDEMFMDFKCEKPTEFGIGLLSEDWEYIKRIADEEDAPLSILLTKFPALLRYIGEHADANYD